MLSRTLLILCLLLPAQPSVASALAEPPSGGATCSDGEERDPLTGDCVVIVDPGGGGSGGDDGGGGGDQGSDDGGGGSGGIPVCRVDSVTGFYAGLADPQPEPASPVWEGHEPGDGAIYVCERPAQTRPGGGFTSPLRALYWAADAPDAPPLPDPAVLAERAVDQMQLRAIDIGIVPEDLPGRVGLVGMPAWMWVADPGENTLGPMEASASAGGFTVVARARVDRIVWDMGDGTTVECHGAGTPYEDRFGTQDSPDCGHTYTRQGEYTVSATSYWTVQWQGIDESGQISIELTESTSITVGEAHVIVQ